MRRFIATSGEDMFKSIDGPGATEFGDRFHSELAGSLQINMQAGWIGLAASRFIRGWWVAGLVGWWVAWVVGRSETIPLRVINGEVSKRMRNDNILLEVFMSRIDSHKRYKCNSGSAWRYFCIDYVVCYECSDYNQYWDNLVFQPSASQ